MLRLARTTARVVTLAVTALSLLILATITLGPRTGRFQVLTVLTGSMRPGIAPGALAIVQPKPRHELKVGDVLTYTIPVEDRRVITHRVVEVARAEDGGTIVRTKGDANADVDPWLAELSDPTVWTERFALPYVGAAIGALRSPAVHRVGQLAPLLLVAAFLRNLWGKDEQPDVAPA